MTKRFITCGALLAFTAALAVAQTTPPQTDTGETVPDTAAENAVRVRHAQELDMRAVPNDAEYLRYLDRPEWLKKYPIPNEDTVNVAASAPASLLTEQDKALAKLAIFSKDDLWNKDISKEPVDPDSAKIIASVGLTKPLHPDFGTKYGIPFQLVDEKTPRRAPKFQYPDESDKGPYPIPLKPLIEGISDPASTTDGDRHILAIDSTNHKLYELYHCFLKDGTWNCGSGAIFDLTKNSYGQRPKGWTSADAAGLPIFPGLARYDEICIAKQLTHALRFTVVKSRHAYIAPATHYAAKSTDPALPPMGLRVRLKADFDVSGYPPEVQVILKGLKTYGMILADNGSDWFVSGAPDARWNDDNLNTLKKIKGGDFEVVKMGTVTSN